MAHLIEMNVWAPTKGRWHGELQGAEYEAGISLIFNTTERTGFGPRLHQHPYAETFIIRKGYALFTVGGKDIKAGPGQILVVPANTPHKFKVTGPGMFESIDIHAAESFVTEWLE